MKKISFLLFLLFGLGMPAREPRCDNDSVLNGLLTPEVSGTQAEIAARQTLVQWFKELQHNYETKNIEALAKTFDVWGFDPNYIKTLRTLFTSAKEVRVSFDFGAAVKHGYKDHIYGVNMRQTLTVGEYADTGWLFLLWDFMDPDHPVIRIAKLQTEAEAKEHGIFTLDDFFIP